MNLSMTALLLEWLTARQKTKVKLDQVFYFVLHAAS